jgi:MFS family permease
MTPPRIFYGWWIVAASVFIAMYVGGVVFYGFTAIFEPVAGDLGWSHTEVSFAASLRGLEVGLIAPVIGALVDRWGPRRLMFGGALVAALGLLLLSRVNSLIMFYGSFLLIAIGTGNCASTVLMTAVANWFRKNVGLASGIVVSGFGLGGLLVPVIVRLIDLYQWRSTMVILAVGMLCTVLPLSLLFRHKPEQYGDLPDGRAKDGVAYNSGSVTPRAIQTDVTARRALKSSTFWRISLPFTYHILAVAAIVTHVMPYLSSVGIARSRSSLIATAIPLTSVVGRLGLGSLGDRFDRRRVAACAYALTGLGILCFAWAPDVGTWLLVPFLVLFGIGYGGNNALRPSMTREYFGRTSFGTIFGLLMGVNMLGNFIGPPAAGWVFDTWGSYQSIWFVLAGLALPAMLTVLTIPSSGTGVQPAGIDLSTQK